MTSKSMPPATLSATSSCDLTNRRRPEAAKGGPHLAQVGRAGHRNFISERARGPGWRCEVGSPAAPPTGWAQQAGAVAECWLLALLVALVVADQVVIRRLEPVDGGLGEEGVQP